MSTKIHLLVLTPKVPPSLISYILLEVRFRRAELKAAVFSSRLLN